MAELTLIIIEYRDVQDVVEALKSAKNFLADTSWDAIVVSNSEYQVSEQVLMREKLSNVNVIFSPRNLGYAGGVNRALKEVQSPYVFLLNPDARFIELGLSNLIECMRAEPKIAIIGPKVVNKEGVIQPSCRRFPKPVTFLFVRSILNSLPQAVFERKRYFMEDYNKESRRCVDWVSGGAMLVNMRSVRVVGGMDERYFLYMEDVDWCKRFQMAGWKVIYNPIFTVEHCGQHASLPRSLFKLFQKTTFYHFCSLIKYFLKFNFFRAHFKTF